LFTSRLIISGGTVEDDEIAAVQVDDDVVKPSN